VVIEGKNAFLFQSILKIQNMDYIEPFELWKNNRSFGHIHWSEVRVGMDVYVEFIPYSQKYIDELTPIWGRVVQIGDAINDIKVEREGDTVDLMRSGVHFFGMGNGYDYTIYSAI
jgi:hypothetical protein